MAPKQDDTGGLLFSTTALFTGALAAILVIAEWNAVPPNPAPQNAGALAPKNPAGRDPALAINRMIDRIIDLEGSKYVNHSADRGGPTRWGVTQETLTRCRGTNCTVEDVKTLTRAEAVEIFREHYYLAPKINQLPAMLQPQVFDMSVNHGPSAAVAMLQEVVDACAKKCKVDGCKADGIIGPETLGATTNVCNNLGEVAVNNALVERRRKEYDDIVESNPSQKVFQNGWRVRAESFRAKEPEESKAR